MDIPNVVYYPDFLYNVRVTDSQKEIYNILRNDFNRYHLIDFDDDDLFTKKVKKEEPVVEVAKAAIVKEDIKLPWSGIPVTLEKEVSFIVYGDEIYQFERLDCFKELFDVKWIDK